MSGYTLRRNEGGWHLSSSLTYLNDEHCRHVSSPASPPPQDSPPAPPDAPRLDAAFAGARGRRLRSDLSARKDRLLQLHEPGVSRWDRADEVGRASELPRALARQHLPHCDMDDDQVHADHGRVRV